MLKERHTHECGMGRNCGRAPLYDTAGSAKSHRLFNQGFQVAGLKAGCSHDRLPHKQPCAWIELLPVCQVEPAEQGYAVTRIGIPRVTTMVCS